VLNLGLVSGYNLPPTTDYAIIDMSFRSLMIELVASDQSEGLFSKALCALTYCCTTALEKRIRRKVRKHITYRSF
jgi:hypothetical protein